MLSSTNKLALLYLTYLALLFEIRNVILQYWKKKVKILVENNMGEKWKWTFFSLEESGISFLNEYGELETPKFLCYRIKKT